MTVNQLLNLFYNYVVSNKLLTPASANQYRYTYLPNLPFGVIDSTLNLWITYEGKNGKKGTGNYYERFDGTIVQPPVDETTECSVRNHSIYSYYKKHIRNKNATIAAPAGYDYLQLIADFLEDGDVVYALTIVDIVLGIAVKANSQLPRGKGINSLTYGISALKKLRLWLEFDKSLVQDVPLNSKMDNERDKIVKPLVHKIDGAIALAREIGFNRFIQYAIDQCYFFQPEIVLDRRDVVTGVFGRNFSKKVMTARKTEKGVTSTTYRHIPPDDYWKLWYFSADGFYWPITRDKDGNEATRSIIKKYTGYSVAEGIDSIFKNYIISHIWGNAYDPRYFTNLWNIVLVPAWANNLLDKDSPDEDSLEYILKETIKKIIVELYGISQSDLGWVNHFKSLGIPMCTSKLSSKKSNERKITINIINNHDYHMSTNIPRQVVTYSKNRVGYIVKYPVYI